jgi:hypothetical protein
LAGHRTHFESAEIDERFMFILYEFIKKFEKVSI